ncbi:MAG: two-partner secretion domain-containing protein, partial [Planctomycetota bacterium]
MARSLLILFAVLCVVAGPPAALSEEPVVVAGSATFQNSGGDRTITTSERAIINWRHFSVPSDTTTRFVQPRSASTVLNRVVGRDTSRIDGTLRGNGHVYLINPHGVLIGPTGRVNTHSFTASTLDVENAAFMAGGDLNFRGDSAASVTNLGEIEAIGGDVFLISRSVENRGSLRAPEGKVSLAAGSDVMLTHDRQVYIRPEGSSSEGTGVLNTGSIESASAELKAHGNVYAMAIRNDGVIRATGAIKRDGKVILEGGGGSVINTGILQASNVTEDGKTIGGEIQVLGEDIRMVSQGVVDASGDLGGGTINIGGSFQGKGPLPNADCTLIGPDVRISADAGEQGDGGQVVIWSDGITGFAGRVSARGGRLGGDGGFVEVSGKEGLLYTGSVDTRAPSGTNGMLLLDPTTINIDGVGTDDAQLDDQTILAGDTPPDTMSISNTKIVSELENGGVSMAASTDINVQLAVDASGNTANNPLTLTAPSLNFSNGANITTNDATLTLDGNIILADGATVALGTDTGAGDISITGTVDGTAGGGAESLSFDAGTGSIGVTGTVGGTAPLSSLTVTDSGGTTFVGALDAGTVTLSNTTGTIAFQGDTTITTGLTTAAQGYSVSFTGSTNSVAGNTSFLNTGIVTLGNAGGDSITFVGGLSTTGGPAVTNLAGTVGTTNAAINLNPTSLAGPATLDSGGAAIQVSAISGAQDLTLAAGIGAGTTTVTGAVTNLGDGTGAALTVENGVTGLVRFQSTFSANSGLTAPVTSNVRFDGNVTLGNGDTGTSLPGALQLDGLSFSGFDGLTFGATTLSGGPVALNSNASAIQITSIAGGAQDLTLSAGIGAGTTTVTGTVSNLGDGVGGALMIANGVTGLVRFQDTFAANSGLTAGGATSNIRFDADVTLGDGDTGTSLPGALQLDGLTFSGFDGLTFGATTLSGGPVTLNSNNSAIQIASIAGGAQDLTLDAGTGGAITVTGAVDDITTLTISQSNGATFQSSVGAVTP